MSGRYNYRTGMLPPNSELTQSVIIPVIVFTVFFVFDYLYTIASDRSLRFITVVDYKARASDGVIIIPQDPSNANAIQLGHSVNERTGVEFAYSFFISVDQSTFSGNDEYKHVFHKGYSASLWPLLGPGVFISGKDNTMRVIMNTNKDVLKHADITNIPVNKFFHVVLNCHNSGLDVYVNGSLAHRLPFKGGVVYQNFQDLVLFSPNNVSISNTVTPAVGDDGFNIAGSFSGSFGSLKYARYALSLKEIQALMAEGPPTKEKQTSSVTDTNYLSDTWWANN
jgi:hypothetical protein